MNITARAIARGSALLLLAVLAGFVYLLLAQTSSNTAVAEGAQEPDNATVRAELATAFADAPGPYGEARFASARPVPITNSAARVWITSSGDHHTCVFIPDPAGGFGASCKSKSEVEAGLSLSVLGGGRGGLGDDVIIASIVPDGAEPPTITVNGAKRQLTATDGVAAARVVGRGVVSTAAGDVDLAAISGVPGNGCVTGTGCEK